MRVLFVCGAAVVMLTACDMGAKREAPAEAAPRPAMTPAEPNAMQSPSPYETTGAMPGSPPNPAIGGGSNKGPKGPPTVDGEDPPT